MADRPGAAPAGVHAPGLRRGAAPDPERFRGRHRARGGGGGHRLRRCLRHRGRPGPAPSYGAGAAGRGGGLPGHRRGALHLHQRPPHRGGGGRLVGPEPGHELALTPRALVAALDQYIVGQGEAKRAVAIAIRNRWRRRRLEPELAEEVTPKNIILIGPTGVGKTEIARRLAGLVHAPFLKVEASKFTEVGYVGRDVESMVRDLVNVAVGMVREEMREEVLPRAREAAEERLLDALVPGEVPSTVHGAAGPAGEDLAGIRRRTRDRLREGLRSGRLDDREVEVALEERPSGGLEIFTPMGIEHMGVELQNIMERLNPGRRQARRLKVQEARELLVPEEADRLLDRDRVHAEGRRRAEESGILFIDEIDKIASRGGERTAGPDVSREGVQRDLLPIVEGSTVATRYGQVRTDHILFIAAGAFHVARPGDLIPELQGRFPVRVELAPLDESDLHRILTEPRNALSRQYEALLSTEGFRLEWRPDGLREVARVAAEVNRSTQDIGARRLATVLERLLEEALFAAPDAAGGSLRVDAEFVRSRMKPLLEDEDLARYVL
ncbi:MAG: ATP-dependent protease ATPase subunit HslU [Planctomycetes bacterium]|nr:ATP-dependent protease ATPase subunit HslU [Planctomycetota bacterium]